MPSETNESVKASGGGGAAPSDILSADPLGALNQLESHFGAIKRMHAEVAEREAKLGEQLAELAAQRQKLEAELATVSSDRQTVASEREELQRAQDDILQKLQSIDDARRELEAKARQVAAEREQAQLDRAAANQLIQELEERESHVQSTLMQVEAREQTLAAQARRQEADQSAREAVVREKEIAVAQKERAAGKDAEQLRREVESLKQKLASGGDTATAAREQVAALEAQLEQLKSESETRLADVQTRLAASTAALASRDAEIAHLKSELETIQKRVAAAEAKLAEHAKAPPAPAAPAQAAAPAPDLSKYETAIKLLTERLKKAEGEKNALAKQLDSTLEEMETDRATSASSISKDEYTARVQSRRARLRRYKGLLQAQARKLMQAQSALAKRQSEAEQVLAQRSRIVAAMTTLQRREAEVAKQKSRSATAAMMFYATAGLAVLLALSWGAAYKLAPATYAARAVLHGDGQGRAPSDPEFVAWQQYVQSLVDDPQMIEQAAERLDRRGIAELASGGTLRQELKSTLYTDISTPKAITLEIRGDNAARTEIVLDTLVSTLVSTANGTRSQRPDGIAVAVSQPAATTDAPIKDQRLMYTGGIFATSATLFLGVGTLVGRRLGRLKRSANEDEMLDDAFGDSDDPTNNK